MSFNIGKVQITEGEDLTLFATGYMLVKALDAAQRLKTEGIRARVLLG